MKTKRTLFSMVVFLSVFWLSVILDIKNPSIPVQKKDGADDLTSVNIANEQVLTSSIASFSLDGSQTTEDNKLFFYQDMAVADINTNMEADGSIQNDAAVQKSVMNETLAEEADLSTDANNKNTIETKEEVPEKESPKYSNIGISIANNFVNIREKANTESDILGKLFQGSAAEILDEVDDWYYVESGSLKGYVKSEFIKTGLSDDELIDKYGMNRISVNVDGLNVREKADIDSEKLTVIYKDEKYPVIDLKNDWIKVDISDDKVIGYVKSEHVDLIVDFKEAVSKEEEAELERLKAIDKAKSETEVKYRNEVNYSDSDLKLLACLVHAEAGNQSYEGKLAVANVVLNRVKSNKYPDSIKSVIYQSGQFSVARSGSLDKQLSNYDNYSSNSQLLTIKAAKAALNGANNIGDRLYFHSYKAAVRKGYDRKKSSVRLDGHLFW